MRNILQHAAARTITFQIQLTHQQFTLHLCDDGQGFAPATVSPRGLRFMQ